MFCLYTTIPVQLLPLLKYFGETYIIARSVGAWYFLHTYEMLNVHEITFNNDNETNHFCEGWNSYFNQFLVTNNSSFWLEIKWSNKMKRQRELKKPVLNQIQRGTRPDNLTSKSSKKK